MNKANKLTHGYRENEKKIAEKGDRDRYIDRNRQDEEQ